MNDDAKAENGKSALLQLFQEDGGASALLRLLRDDPRAFYRLLEKEWSSLTKEQSLKIADFLAETHQPLRPDAAKSKRRGSRSKTRLRALSRWALNRALERDDLNSNNKGELQLDYLRFRNLLDLIGQRSFCSTSTAYDLALEAFLIGLSADIPQESLPRIRADAKKKQAQLGGVASGEFRKKEAEETWHPGAKELAIEARAKDKGASKAAVARFIRDHWKLLRSVLPESDRTLERFVTSLENDGVLPPRYRSPT